MREIVFRGKRTDTGEWLYGDLVHSKDKTRCGILVNEAETYDECEVNRNTVGQYTGLKDRNGREIYDGDILSIYDRQGHFNIIVKWDKEAMAFLAYYCSGDQSPLSWFSPLLIETYEIEVIGNIHDNPELLEEGK